MILLGHGSISGRRPQERLLLLSEGMVGVLRITTVVVKSVVVQVFFLPITEAAGRLIKRKKKKMKD